MRFRGWAVCAILPALHAQMDSPKRLRASATRSVELLQRAATGFYKSQDCFSCHSYGLPMLVFRTARERGIPVDEAAAHAAAVKGLAHNPDFTSIDRAIQSIAVSDPLQAGWALLAVEAAGLRPNLVTAIYARLSANWQHPDGRWTTLDTRPPQSNSEFTATAVTLRAIALHAPETMRKEVAERSQRARKWFLAAQPRTTEDYTFRLFGLTWAGAPAAERSGPARDLLRLQRPNGGWAQIPRMEPDAYSTGEALVALAEGGGIAVTDAAWKKGLSFLLSSQKTDGSWHVPTRMVSPAQVSPPYFETGFPHGKDQVLSTMATSWAALAVMRALDKVDHPAAPLPLPELAPKDPKPWMETVLFGTAGQLKAHLDHGLDPNTKTAEGTSLLMAAAPDAAKVKLLVERGADVKAKAKSRYTALMCASLYRGTSDILKVLLVKGAEAAPGPGVMFSASPLFLAALAGDPENITLLRSKGADPNRKMILFGFFPSSALLTAVTFGDPEVVKALVAAGADVREKDPDGMSALHWAALSDHVGVTRVLVEAGGLLNATDKHGYTPLMYAATVDFGSAEMVSALLNAGADPQVRNKDGRTALAQAKHYRYAHIQTALEQSGARE
ncbi:MAG: ankyrin repeat domain-containing protein [Acidobacteria bacterium]|nr:ankyrin repeat domain-containing protein [Acidobacteriota bacterium]